MERGMSTNDIHGETQEDKNHIEDNVIETKPETVEIKQQTKGMSVGDMV